MLNIGAFQECFNELIPYIGGSLNLFLKLLTAYATRKYAVWAGSSPFCYLEKS